MSVETMLDAMGEDYDLFRNKEYMGKLKGSLNKKEKVIFFKPNEDICKGDKLVRKELEKEFIVLDLDIKILHGQPLYKEISYSKENFEQINKGVNATIQIEHNYASINTAGGNIECNNTTMINETCNTVGELKKLIDKLIPTINQIKLNQIEKEDLKDDLEVVSEQIESDKPKPSRLRKAYLNIKGVVEKASKGAVTTAVLLGDWQRLIEKLQELIKILSEL